MENFASLGLPEQLTNSLKLLNFITPTPIQVKVIPDALLGRDILGSAQTGSGKTAAFGIPLISKLISNPNMAALVMAPTRELAVQVIKMLESLIGKNSNIKTALLIGGEQITKQFQKLRAKPRLIVGTPGRINDHIIRGTVRLDNVEFLVLDETDRMLDMGFTPQIDSILELIPKNRQTLLFSATLPKNIMFMSNKYLVNPLRVAIEEIAKPVSTLKQEKIEIQEHEKYDKLLEELGKRDGSIIIFAKTKIGVDRLAKNLKQDGNSVDSLHGDLRHNRREKAISGFRASKYRILVATDIAARGLDIPHIMHVINYDLPQCPEDYLHRIGRTARAGAEGSSLCFISPADREKWKIINKFINSGEAPDQPNNFQRAPSQNNGKRNFKGKDSWNKNSRDPKFNKNSSQKFTFERKNKSNNSKPFPYSDMSNTNSSVKSERWGFNKGPENSSNSDTSQARRKNSFESFTDDVWNKKPKRPQKLNYSNEQRSMGLKKSTHHRKQTF
jgi:ATP-dependent RNA helicase DeaD